MSDRDESARLRRLKIWIPGLSLPAAGAALALSSPRWAAGLAAGGVIILLNLLGTERAARRFLEADGTGKVLAGIFQVAKLGITAAVLAGLITAGIASPFALLLGISTLPVALVFDFFFVPDNKGVEKRGA